MTKEELIKKFENLGIKQCKHENLPVNCEWCKYPRKKPEWEEYQFQTNKMFSKIYNCELKEIHLSETNNKFDGGNLENRILLDAKSSKYTRSNSGKLDNFAWTLSTMIFAEIIMQKTLQKVLVFYSEELAKEFIKRKIRGKMEISTKPFSIQIWYFDGIVNFKQLF